jgi:hypothetical protein
MLDFQLFRLKVYRIPGSLFSTDESPPSLIRSAILSRPERRSRRGVVWHIGNVEAIDDSALYFAFGRTTVANLPQFNAADRSFVEQEFESAPFTHVIVDSELGLCAIARKSQLAPNTIAMARQLANVLNDAPTAYDKNVRFAIEPIADPEQFIEQLREAQSVIGFSVTFSLPNPFDANQDFQLPMERLLQEAEGEKGRTTISGDDLDRDVLEELSRSAAATGNDASARLYREGESRSVKKRLRENFVSVPVTEITIVEARLDLVQTLRRVYLRIRHSVDG